MIILTFIFVICKTKKYSIKFNENILKLNSMPKTKVLLKDYLLYFVGNSSTRFITLLLIPLFTRTLTKGEYGYFEIVNATILILVPIISLQLSEAVLRFKLDKKESADKKNVIETITALLIITAIISNIIFFIITDFITINYKIEVLLFFNTFYASSYLLRIARALGRRTLYSSANVSYSLILALTAVYFYLTNNLTLINVFNIYSISNFVISTYLILRIGSRNLFSFSKIEFKYFPILLAYSVPLLMEAMNLWVMDLSDRFIIKFYIGLDAVGVYGVAYKLGISIYFLQIIFNLIWQEESFKEHGNEQIPVKNAFIFNNLARLLFSAFTVLLPFFDLYIKLFVDKRYADASSYLALILGGIIFSSLSSFWGIKYQVSKNTKGSLYTSLTGGIANIALNIFLVPVIGLYGAALSTFVSFFIIFIIRISDSKFYIDTSLINIKSLILGFTISLIFGFVITLNIPFIDYILLFTGSIFSIFFNKDLIVKIYSTITGNNK